MLAQPDGRCWIVLTQALIQPLERRGDHLGFKAHHQSARQGWTIKQHGHLQPGGDQNQQGVIAILRTKGKPLEACRRGGAQPLASDHGKQRLALRQHLLKPCRDPDPPGQVLQQRRFVESGQGSRQPHPL
jgi:hypothetical protein